ncbi:four-helix bundle copper-binding protein [Bacillus sp. SD075]
MMVECIRLDRKCAEACLRCAIICGK